MILEEYIDLWTKKIQSENILDESIITSNRSEILKAFKDDFSEERLVPNVDFLKIAYNLINKRLLKNILPSSNEIKLLVKSHPERNYVGCAAYRVIPNENKLFVRGIMLNSSRMLTLHGWLEVILHEMIHVVDFTTVPEHFLAAQEQKYDSHGEWFLSYGKQFLKDGFNVKQYCTTVIGINSEDVEVQKFMKEHVLVLLDGFEGLLGKGINLVDKKDLKSYMKYCMTWYKKGYFKGLKRFIILKSENPEIVNIKLFNPNDINKKPEYDFYTERFIKQYGPFKKVITYKIPERMLLEDRDELDYDEMNHLDDSYSRKIYDNITNVVDLKKIDDESYEITIA